MNNFVLNFQNLRQYLQSFGWWGEITFGLLIFFVVNVGVFVLHTTVYHFSKRLQNQHFKNIIGKNLVTLNWFFSYTVSFWISLIILDWSFSLAILLSQACFIILCIYFALVLQQWAIYFSNLVLNRNHQDAERFGSAALGFLGVLIKGMIWFLVVIFVFDYFGLNVTGLVTSLGISGIAIAFALQNILGDIFASFTIFFDKPFEVGDYIEVGADKGKVVKIGLRSTRIETFKNEILIISNKELTTTRVRNLKDNSSRKLSLNLSLAIPKKIDSLTTLTKELEKVIVATSGLEFVMANIEKIESEKVFVEVIYVAKTKKYLEAMKMQESINLAALKIMAKLGLS